MTPQQKEQVKKNDPDFHRVATIKAPLALKVKARRQKRQLSPTLKGTTWLQKKCSKCGGGEVFYLPHWKVRPEHCDHCRLHEFDLKGLFESFLAREAQLRKHCGTSEDRQIFAEREKLRPKVQNALRKSAHTPKHLCDICERDEELTRLAFRLIKEERLERRLPRGGGKNTHPISGRRFLQGEHRASEKDHHDHITDRNPYF